MRDVIKTLSIAHNMFGNLLVSIALWEEASFQIYVLLSVGINVLGGFNPEVATVNWKCHSDSPDPEAAQISFTELIGKLLLFLVVDLEQACAFVTEAKVICI